MSKAISFALVVLCVSAGARELQQAAAPAPSAKPVADLLFIFSADKVSAAIPHSVQCCGIAFSFMEGTRFTVAPAFAGIIYRRKSPGAAERQFERSILWRRYVNSSFSAAHRSRCTNSCASCGARCSKDELQENDHDVP